MAETAESKEERTAKLRRIVHEQIFSRGRGRLVFISTLISLGVPEDRALELFDETMKQKELLREAEAADMAEIQAEEEALSVKQSGLEAVVSNENEGTFSHEESHELARSVIDGTVTHPRFSFAGPEERLQIIAGLLASGGMFVGDTIPTAKEIDSILVRKRERALMELVRKHKLLNSVEESNKERFSRILRKVVKAMANDPRIRLEDALAAELAGSAPKEYGSDDSAILS